MNRTPSGFQSLEIEVKEFLEYKQSEGLSPSTLVSYRQVLGLFVGQMAGASLDEIAGRDIIHHFNWLKDGYVTKRMTGTQGPIKNKTVRNHWVALKSFFKWLEVEYDLPNIMDKIRAPKVEKIPVEPLTREEIEQMLKVCVETRRADTVHRAPFTMRRSTGVRDRAIVLFLLDTGLRASEFCSLRIQDVDFARSKVSIRHGSAGGAKGGKGRFVYMGRITRQTLKKYLATREDRDNPDAPLFLSKMKFGMTVNSLRLLIVSLSERAGIRHCSPHKFRHTFAITYLRSGGDVFTLQSLLGHSSLDMVRHYSMIADIDVEQAHRKASPVDNLRF